MKKILTLILCLLLCLPAQAFAEATAETVLVDFGDFTMMLPELRISHSTKEDNLTLAVITFPYDRDTNTADKINIVWSSIPIGPEVELHGADAYAQALLESDISWQKMAGLDVSNAQILLASYEEGIFAYSTKMDVDYTAVGLDLVQTSYYMHFFLPAPDNSTYVFTLISTSPEGLEAMLPYLNTIVFK